MLNVSNETTPSNEITKKIIKFSCIVYGTLLKIICNILRGYNKIIITYGKGYILETLSPLHEIDCNSETNVVIEQSLSCKLFFSCITNYKKHYRWRASNLAVQ